MIHWTWLVFGAIIGAIILRLIYNENKIRGDYVFDLESPILIIVLIAFILIWGGIFWW